MKGVKCPKLIIHGRKDEIISCSHSVALYELDKTRTDLILVDSMTHARFNFFDDLCKHIINFLEKINNEN